MISREIHTPHTQPASTGTIFTQRRSDTRPQSPPPKQRRRRQSPPPHEQEPAHLQPDVVLVRVPRHVPRAPGPARHQQRQPRPAAPGVPPEDEPGREGQQRQKPVRDVAGQLQVRSEDRQHPRGGGREEDSPHGLSMGRAAEEQLDVRDADGRGVGRPRVHVLCAPEGPDEKDDCTHNHVPVRPLAPRLRPSAVRDTLDGVPAHRVPDDLPGALPPGVPPEDARAHLLLQEDGGAPRRELQRRDGRAEAADAQRGQDHPPHVVGEDGEHDDGEPARASAV
ncbi:hypothetical protein CDEST_08659 [Colletotrichum destructivum]|uniref:Uncharacterized protein n=1 Tax=Colletotrichum destructivum TaxID=34406 RepID=A0AAX4IJT9_9PEZI|nr:hypothetical protein CDEST_08659 [Colletotrichum destructivum]